MAANMTLGKIRLISADVDECLVILIDPTPDLKPGNGYFRLTKANLYFDAIYSLLLTAGVQRSTVRIITTEAITPGEKAYIKAAQIDFIL